ncbi:hypothetical protein [Nocardia crassostreae]|uniref:WXG100-like domain-containing protein n=1 Tax=Nocardia crassostreae TaxID=53428 RepID=UPI000829C6DB|nr:hypothetical protein [Nocardia crassostreae]
MTLYCAPELRWVAWLTGNSWPDGDEDRMWDIADDWQQAADTLRALLKDIDTAKKAALEAYPSGAGHDAIGTAFDLVRSGDQSVEALVKVCEEVRNSVFDTATEIQATKLTIIMSWVALAIEITWAWLFPPTAPAVQSAAIAATRSFLSRVEKAMQDAITKFFAKLGPKVSGFIGTYSVKILESALISAAMDGMVQGGQLAAGTRRHFDAKQFGASVMGSVVSTIPGREFAKFLGKSDKWFGDTLGNMRGGAVLRGTAIGIGAGAMSTVFSALGAATVTGKVDLASPESWVGGMARGGLVGGARGGFTVGKVPANGRMGPWKGVFRTSDSPSGGPGGSRPPSEHSMHTLSPRPTADGSAPHSTPDAPPRAATPDAQPNRQPPTSWDSSSDNPSFASRPESVTTTTSPSAGAATPGSGASSQHASSPQPSAAGNPTGAGGGSATGSAGPSVHAGSGSNQSGAPGGADGSTPRPGAVADHRAEVPGRDRLGPAEDMKSKTRPKVVWDQPVWPTKVQAAPAPDKGIWLAGQQPQSVNSPPVGVVSEVDVAFTMSAGGTAPQPDSTNTNRKEE